MKEYTLESIKLIIEDQGKDKYHLVFDQNTGKKAFDRGRKIYIVSFVKKVFYVGETITSIKTRLQGGCNSFNKFSEKGKKVNGYGGYQWLDKADNQQRALTLSVAIFEKEYDEKKELMEAIEGEIVNLIRNKERGYWPKFQNEIHFHYKYSKKTIKIAKCICNELKLA